MNTRNIMFAIAVVAVAIIAGIIGYHLRVPQAPTATTTVSYVSTTVTTVTTTITASYTTTVTATTSYYPIEVADALNRTLVISSEPATVVSLAPSITQMLVALGLCNRIIGLDQFSYQLLSELNATSCLPANAEVIKINAMSPTGFNETVMLLHPDIVLADAGFEALWARDLPKTGLNVYFLRGTLAANITGIEEDLLALGKIFHKEQRAQALVTWMNRELEIYGAPLNASVAVIVWINPDGSFYAAGNNTFISAVVDAAGGINAIERGGWGPFEPSLLIASNPDVIVLSAMGVSNCTYALQALDNIPGVNKVAAYRSGRVYVVSGLPEDALEEPSLMSVYAVVMLHKVLTGNAPHCLTSAWFLKSLNATLLIKGINSP
ncbi:ABC transporter substrate-binding protein [Thermoproteus tenax]|nr:ABC transporter substrate-binding protein [Thermoproteus tenax]